MKRLIPAVALALVVGTAQPGCICTAAGALIGLIVGRASDDPGMDVNDHVRNGALIGLEIDAALFCGMSTGCWCSRDRVEGDRMYELALLDASGPGAGANAKRGPRTEIIVSPTSCTLACRF